MTIKTVQDSKEPLKSTYTIPELPLSQELETKAVLKMTNEASRALAELKGVALSMPNQNILINTLALQEAKDSSEIENIITTNDELYQSNLSTQQFVTASAKEVHLYSEALRNGFTEVQKSGLLLQRTMKTVQAKLEGNDAGFRSQSGTALKNETTDQIVYVPPQELQDIETHMLNLERFINEDTLSDLDSLIKMALIHHQFESIHPFFDGNGRTGRIINILYLVKEDLLDTPVLYLSRYINQNKPEYYRLLQAVRNDGAWEEWILFILKGIHETARQTTKMIKEIKTLMLEYKHRMRQETKFYSQDLLNNLFSHPYTKIEFVENDLDVHRNTASKYLDELARLGFVVKIKIVNQNYYLNQALYHLLENSGVQTSQENEA